MKKVTSEALVTGSDIVLLDYETEAENNNSIFSTKNTEKNFGGTVYSQILARRGQQKFRNGLLKRYGARCLITECEILDLIEAAHIVPFRIEESHNLNNGILLRSDIHTLFDLNLIGIDKEFVVHINPRILSEYSEISNKKLKFSSDEKPNIEKVKFKWNEFLKHSNLK